MPLFSELEKILNGEIINLTHDDYITYLITDSRKATLIKGSIFFAIEGERHDGHKYLQDLFNKGIENFVIEKPVFLHDKANVIKVDSSLRALQALAIYHRKKFDLPVVAITGSNGKTIVKEWLYRLLASSKNVVKSPRSYNSQLGVPLSVWGIGPKHDLGVFEAGISQPGEMENLEKVIQPTIGIFTNLGSAHDEGFASRKQKAQEKAKLFKNTNYVIYQRGNSILDDLLEAKGFSWGVHPNCDVLIKSHKKQSITLEYENTEYKLRLPFEDLISTENVMHAIALMLKLNLSLEQIQSGLNLLSGVKMRLEMKRGIKGSYIIDDSYNNDFVGLQTALEFLKTAGTSKKAVILSDIPQSGTEAKLLYQELAELIKAAQLHQFVGIGPELHQFSELFGQNVQFYRSTEEAIANLHRLDIANSTLLVKGARSFQLENLVMRLEEKNHGTRFEINLDALSHNLNFYRSLLNENTKLMVMVKAFGYGAGSFDVANLLAYHNVDYLGVAYTDEGIALREQGIRLPIMVMNPSPGSYDKLVTYQLEPEIYSLDQLKNLEFAINDPIGIHLKLETGMNRLGFSATDLDELMHLLRANAKVKVKSLFSHLAGADAPEHESFSKEQIERFEKSADYLCSELNIHPLRHILNSPGITRFPQHQLDMVRLGIGLYGIDTNQYYQNGLATVGTLKTVISQVKHVKKGETVGYGRMGLASDDMAIATIAIGYADGFSRAFSQGVGKVWTHGTQVPVVGNVCMDMAMIDVTGLPVKEGDEVEVFGQNLSLQDVAKSINTIPYEILATIGGRVKRTYYSE
ncbi:MAG: bifunctional UDP-N-acetylmuramoyl-tripeptide:D-alanyl-D-alanine ligase/alanine racemase [Bacteroidota bacterium]